MTAEFGSLDDRAQALAARSLDADALVPVGRLGWVANGAVYVLVGVLAVPIAFGGSGRGSGGVDEASRSGALQQIAETSFGGILLWMVGIGLFLYAAWRLVTAVLPGDNDAATWVHRAGYLGSAVLYGLLGWSAITIATSTGSGGSGSSNTIERLSRNLLESTGGQWLLGAVALGVLGAAGYYGYKGWNEAFMDELDMAEASSQERSLTTRLGRLGWIGRAVTTGLIGVFILQAALTADADEAKGLDGALRDTADSAWGAALVVLAGVGLVAYGLFAIMSARRRRLVGP